MMAHSHGSICSPCRTSNRRQVTRLDASRRAHIALRCSHSAMVDAGPVVNAEPDTGLLHVSHANATAALAQHPSTIQAAERALCPVTDTSFDP
jgi:hypothetical protein